MLNIKKLFDPSRKTIKTVKPIIEKINALEPEFEKKSDDEIRELIKNFRSKLKPLIDDIPEIYKSSLKAPGKDKDYVAKEENIHKILLSYLPEMFAATRESLKRKVGYRQFDVQMIAAAILAQGYKLTENKTGEGKTLIFQLTAALYGLTGRGSHVVTVNDYLARRDGEYAGHILNMMGLTVGVITPESAYRFIPDEDVVKYKGDDLKESIEKQQIKNPGDCEGLNLLQCTKREAYSCDIVYGTNNEFGFDYLRDNMVMSTEDIVQRELYFCIVDEADSILIDEARTPLIISSPAEQSNELYVKFANLIPKLKKDEDYTVDEKAHSVFLTDEGAVKMEKLLGVKNIWQDYRLAHHLENALKAYELYKLDIHYLVRNGEVHIVDQFTGRVLEGRRYSEGLHQAIEAKEGVEIKRESKTLGTITFQNFFRLYKILSGGSGTVMTEAEEFYKIYNLESVEVPTNKPVNRIDYNDRVYKNREAKFNAVANEVVELNKKGQPVLVGTTSIEDSEYLSKLLENIGVEHQVLNAKYHERESKIVANAGKKGAVTVATNMAGRGTDIKLGGKHATDEEFEEVINIGGLAVIGTQRHESRRIDNQLRGRSGRQGEPGFTRFYVGLDDEIMRIQGGEIVQRIMEMTNLPDDIPIEAGIVGKTIETAQKRMEGMHFDSRKSVVEYDDVVNQQREIFYSRRRRILEEIESADKQMEEGKSIDVNNSELAKQFKERLDLEVALLTSKHFIDDRKDEIDRVKVIDDFMDLAPDQQIDNAVKDLGMNVKGNSIKEHLLSLVEVKQQQEIVEILTKVSDKLLNDKLEEFGKEVTLVAKVLFLRTMDQLWTDHLDAMKALRDGIGLRQFAQQDPLVEYKNEGFEIFDNFIATIDTEIARRVLKLQKVVRTAPEPVEQMQTNEDQVKDVNSGTREMMSSVRKVLNKTQNEGPIRTEPQKTITKSMDIGRNDKVDVRYSDGREEKNVKFKKVENDVKYGKATITKRY